MEVRAVVSGLMFQRHNAIGERCVETHVLPLNMLESWKQCVARGWEGRFIVAAFMFIAWFML